MRLRSLLLLGVALGCGCGQSGAFAEHAPRDPEAIAVPSVVRPAARADAAPPPAPVGGLEGALGLERFFAALARLDEGGAADDVRVVQLGDSHTAADLETSVARKALQGRFGDGGRGFVALGRPWKTYLQDGLRAPGMTREWTPEHGKLDRGRFVGDGRYGLGGFAITTSKRGARAWTELALPSSTVELSYLEQPAGGSFEVVVDGTTAARVSSKAAAPASAFKAITVPEGPHKVEVIAAGDGEVRVFGVAFDRALVGVSWDALGINGARASTALQWDEVHVAEQLRHRAPALVVIAYGTNESVDDAPIATHERHLVDLLGRVARAVPGASCLLLGPPDRAVESYAGWSTPPRVSEIVEMERAVARAGGCAFFDRKAAMGGSGSMAAWAEESTPRAQRDRVHLTREGYATLGQLLADDVVRAYAAWRSARGLPPGVAPPPRVLPPLPATDPAPSTPAASPFVAIPL